MDNNDGSARASVVNDIVNLLAKLDSEARRRSIGLDQPAPFSIPESVQFCFMGVQLLMKWVVLHEEANVPPKATGGEIPVRPLNFNAFKKAMDEEEAKEGTEDDGPPTEESPTNGAD